MFGTLLYIISILVCMYSIYLMLYKVTANIPFVVGTDRWGDKQYEYKQDKIKFPLIVYIGLFLVSFVPIVNVCVFGGIWVFLYSEYNNLKIDSILFEEI